MALRLHGILLAVLLAAPLCFAARNTPKDVGLTDFAVDLAITAHVGTEDDDEPSHEEQSCLRFLYRYMPEADREKLKFPFFEKQSRLALKARADNDWASEVPWDIFLGYVLPYANLDEPREEWRSEFYEKFSPLVSEAASTLEAAAALNWQIWTLGGWNITFKAGQTPDIMSPSQVISHGYASCTGLAIFLVDACRAVGIPARVAGIAEWPGTGGNHNWVEVWHAGGWHFTDPLGFPGRPFNTTWFVPDPVRLALPGSYVHGVYAASFKHTGGLFPLAWHDEYESNVPGHEVTRYYLEAAAAAPPPSEAAVAAAAALKTAAEMRDDVASAPTAVMATAAAEAEAASRRLN